MFTVGFVFIILIASFVSAVHFPPPSSCDNEETWFKSGQTYSYKYDLESNSDVFPSSESSNVHHLTCDVILDVLRDCEMVLYTKQCALGTSQNQIDREQSARLTLEMARNHVYLKYNKGEVIDHQIFLHKTDSLPIKNLKRGIISLMQLNIVSTTEQWTSDKHGILGSCKTQTKLIPSDDGHQVETYSDLTFCNHTGHLQYQNSLFSMVKTTQSGHSLPPISQLINPVESSVKCQYKVTPSLTVEEASCVQEHVYTPTLFNGLLATNISQSLRLISKGSVAPKEFPRQLIEYITADLAMEFEDSPERDVLGDDIENALEQFFTDISSHGFEGRISAKRFKIFVSQLRNAQEEIIRNAKNSIFACENTETCFKFVTPQIDQSIAKELKRKSFVSGLLSCGSESCLLVLGEMFKEEHINGLESAHILFNIGLSYQPHLKVMETIHDYCRSNTESAQCWFSLAAMLNRFKARNTEEAQSDTLIASVVQYLHDLLVTKCQQHVVEMNGAQRRKREDFILIALKALGNIGRLPVEFQEKHRSASTLMQCIRTNQDDVIIALNAVNTLSKMDLLEESSHLLNGILQDDNAEMALRTSIFDAFIAQGGRNQMRILLSILDTTKLDTMRTYVVTKVFTILESPDPSLTGLQQTLQELITSKQIPDVKGILSKSHYAEMSHHFTIPLTPLSVGTSVGISVIFNPASNFFQTFTVNIGFGLNGERMDGLEVTVYLEGVDTVIDFIRDLKENSSKILRAENVMEMFHKYINDMARGKILRFDHLETTLMEQITQIFTQANVMRARFPKAHVALKLFDYNVAFFSADSILKHLMDSKKYIGKGLVPLLLKDYHQFWFSASKLTDFQQTIPSIGGLPIEFEVDSTLVTGVDLQSKGKLEHKSKWNKEFIFDWSMAPSVSMSQDAKVITRLDGHFDTDLRHEVWISGLASLDANVKTTPQLFQRYPACFLDIKKRVGQDTFTFLDAGSELFTTTNGVKTPIVALESSNSTFEKCLPGVYEKMTGHKVCVMGSYPQGVVEGQLSLMPSLASTRITGVIIPTDRNLRSFNFNGYYQATPASDSGFRLQGNFEGKGSELSRSVFLTIESNTPNYECQIILEDPNVVFLMRSVNNKIDDVFTKRLYVSVTHNEFTTHSLSYLLEKTTDRETRVDKTSLMKANVTLARGDLSVSIFRRKTNNSNTATTDFVEINYHCKPSLPLLYALHPRPDMASESGHVSRFSLTTEAETSGTSFIDTWTGMHWDQLALPGHHVSHTSRLVADLNGASRTTNITWTAGRIQHNYSMVGRVQNKTTSALNQYAYRMHVLKVNDYVMDLEGDVTWTHRTGLNLSGNVDYESLGPNTNQNVRRRKRSLSSIWKDLRHDEKRMEEIAVNAYGAAKTGLWTAWNGQPGSGSGSEVNNNMSPNQNAMAFHDSVDTNQAKTESILQLPKWDLSFNVGANLKPDVVQTPVGMRVVGIGCDWLANVSMFKDEETMFQSTGTVYKGRNFRISGSVEDNAHQAAILFNVEHVNNNELFYHYHKFHLTQGEQHSMPGSQSPTTDQKVTRSSSEVRVRLQHDVFPQLPHFLFDVDLSHPLANVTYHLNYTKVAAKKHQIRAQASVSSDTIPFGLQYKESTNVSERMLQSSFEMNNTFLNYTLTLMKSRQRRGIGMDGRLKYNVKLPFFMREGKVGVHVHLAPRQPPICRIVYHPVIGQEGVLTTITLLGPKALRFTVNTHPEPLMQNQATNPIITWTVTLIKPRVLQHSVNVSELGTNVILSWVLESRTPWIDEANVTGVPELFTVQDIQENLENTLNMTETQNPHSRKVKILNFLIASVKTWKHFWDTSVPVTIYRTFHLDEGVDFVTKLTARMAAEMIHRPPFVVRRFAKLYVHPQLQTIMRGRQVTMTTSLPFVWESFRHFPQGTMTDRELMEEMQLSKVVSIYRDMAVLLDGTWVRTFDGQWVDIGGLTCTYLMAADLKRQSFIVLYSKTDGVTVLSSRSGAILKADGTFSLVDGHNIGSLPFTTEDNAMTITLHDGKPSVLLSNGLARLTFDVKLNLYLFEAAQQLNNVSLGLWGTNNQEPGDDFRLPDRTISDSSLAVQSRYQLSQGQHCSASNNVSSSCTSNNEANSLCQNFFHRNVTLATCALQINPLHFLNVCKSKECLGESGCPVIKAYIEACKHKGLSVQSPMECDQCHRTSRDTIKTDVVFVQCLHTDLVDENGVFDKAIKIASSLSNPDTDVMMGFVTYSGSGPRREPMAHLINQKLFNPVNPNDYATSMSLVTATTSQTSMSPDGAIQLAANFPFREESVHLVILIHPPQVNKALKDGSKLANVLKEKNIHFLSATSRPDYTAQGIVGTLYNETTDGQIQDRNGIDALVKDTEGAWLSMDSLTTTGDFLQNYQGIISTQNINTCLRDV